VRHVDRRPGAERDHADRGQARLPDELLPRQPAAEQQERRHERDREAARKRQQDGEHAVEEPVEQRVQGRVDDERYEPREAPARAAQAAGREVPRLLVEPLQAPRERQGRDDQQEHGECGRRRCARRRREGAPDGVGGGAREVEPADQAVGQRFVARLRCLDHDQERDHGTERLRPERERAVEQVEAQQRLDQPAHEVGCALEHRPMILAGARVSSGHPPRVMPLATG